MLEVINQRYMKFLFEIARRPRSIAELARRNEMHIQAASTLISRWEKQDIVLKEKVPAQRGTENIVYMTDYGQAQVELLIKINRNYEKHKKGETILPKKVKKEEKHAERTNKQ